MPMTRPVRPQADPPVVPAVATPADPADPAGSLRRWLLTGTSFMIPFVVTGGVLLSLAAVFGGPSTVGTDPAAGGLGLLLGGDLAEWSGTVGVGSVLYLLGTATLTLLVPVLAGYVAHAMAGPAALVAGMVGGLLASVVGAGYLGGLVAGLLAGGTVLGLRRLRLPSAVDGFASVVAIPLVSTSVVGLVVVTVVGAPVAAATDRVTDLLTQLSAADQVWLGAALGLMVCFDLGGPVNKVAFTFALATLSDGDGTAMAAVLAAGMSAPLGLALASSVRPAVFGPQERTAGKAAWLLGASFVTEGAIPFVVADPLRVLPSVLLGGSLAGALSMAGPVSTAAPHGGLWFVAATSAPLAWLVAIATGTVVTAAAVVAAKTLGRTDPVT